MSSLIRWAPRVSKSKVYRLYKSDAMGEPDAALLTEVGHILYARCRDILIVARAVAGEVPCPACQAIGQDTLIRRMSHKPETVMTCPRCSWSMTWGDYRTSFQRKQLNCGGAGQAFEAFVAGWPAAASPRQGMLLVDRLIHEFHYSLKAQPHLPTRAACVNLIDGKLHDVVAFLDELHEGIDDQDLVMGYQHWRQKRQDAHHLWQHP